MFLIAANSKECIKPHPQLIHEARCTRRFIHFSWTKPGLLYREFLFDLFFVFHLYVSNRKQDKDFLLDFFTGFILF